MFKCSKQPNTEVFVLNIFSRRSRGYYGEVGEKFDLPAVQDFGRRVFDIVSPVPLSGSFEFRPARHCYMAIAGGYSDFCLNGSFRSGTK